MFKKERIFAALSVLMVAAFILGACTTPTPQVIEKIVTQEVKVIETQVVEKEVVKEVVVTPEPVQRNGGWLDRITIVEEPSQDQGIARTSSGEFGVYMYTISNPELFKKTQADPNLAYSQSFGSYNELTFNPAGPVFEGTGKLNPFASPKVREAMNMLIDRNYITGEIMGGLGVPRWLPMSTAFSDYASRIVAMSFCEPRSWTRVLSS